MNTLGDFQWWLATFESTFRVTTPLLFAAMGGLFSERAGVIQIALEGHMLMGAFFASIIAVQTGSWPLGFLGGAVAGVCLAALYGGLTVGARANQIVAGTGINILAAGLAPVLSKIWFGNTTSTPPLALEDRWGWFPHLFVWLMSVGVWIWYRESRSGLRVRFAGEHPEALASAGVSVLKTRFFAVLMSGALAGLGGATLSIALSSSFTRNMTAGRGFIALAALILGRWKPVPTMLACLAFGFADALQSRLQSVVLWGTEPLPVQFIQALPYLITLVVLAGWMGKSRPPSKLGIPASLMLMVALGSGLSLSGCQKGGRIDQLVEKISAKKEDRLKTDAAKKAKANSELLAEMIRVTLLREPKGVFYGTLLDSLNQGASLEGIYRGLTRSSDYRVLEAQTQGARLEAQEMFLKLLSDFWTPAMPMIADMGKPLAHVVQPEFVDAEAGSQKVIVFGKKNAKEPQPSVTFESVRPELKKIYSQASFFTLKRVLAEQALDFLDSKKELDAWYPQWVSKMAGLQINFGLKERNLSDLDFHRKWVEKTDRDRMIWEVLNRLHRVMNSVYQPPKSSAVQTPSGHENKKASDRSP